MTTLDSPSLEAAALQHWQDSLTARHGAEMIANPADLDLEAAHFDEFFDIVPRHRRPAISGTLPTKPGTAPALTNSTMHISNFAT